MVGPDVEVVAGPDRALVGVRAVSPDQVVPRLDVRTAHGVGERARPCHLRRDLDAEQVQDGRRVVDVVQQRVAVLAGALEDGR